MYLLSSTNKQEAEQILNLSEEDKKQLMELARDTIKEVLFGKQKEQF